MPTCCAVPLCANRTPGHKFPLSDKHRLKQWVVAIRRVNFIPTKNSIVCKSHFREDDYELPKESVLRTPRLVLKKNAVPSKFLWNEANSGVLHQKNKESYQRCLARSVKKFSVQAETSLKYTTNCSEVEIECENKQNDIGILF